MTTHPIFTSEPMATRALAAEIRHAPERFVARLARLTGAELPGHPAVRCEGKARLDVELRFAATGSTGERSVGIEAKFDHELTPAQVDKELRAVDYLVILVAAPEFAPEWVAGMERVSFMTWAEALECFADSRLTIADVESLSVGKSTIEAAFRALGLAERLPGWSVKVKRGGGGMPAIQIQSPELTSGRRLRGQIQTVGRGMPPAGQPVLLEYGIGISVAATEAEYPDPTRPHAVPGWIEPLQVLRRDILDAQLDRLLVSTHPAGNGRSGLGRRKLPLAKLHLGDETWLAKGYTDGWALGIKSTACALDDVDELAAVTVHIFKRWYDVETQRLRSVRKAS